MRETWYVLESGDAVHPAEVSINEDGRLAHHDGLVQMREDGETPRSRGVDVPDDFVLAEKVVTGDMKPEPKPAARKRQGYKTRQSKAD